MVSIMQTLENVVMTRERKMLGALIAVGTEAPSSSVMGNTTLPAYREHCDLKSCWNDCLERRNRSDRASHHA